MVYRTRIKYTAAQKADIWDRWQRGESLNPSVALISAWNQISTGSLQNEMHPGVLLLEFTAGEIMYRLVGAPPSARIAARRRSYSKILCN